MHRLILFFGALALIVAAPASAQVRDSSEISASDFTEPADDPGAYDVNLNLGVGGYTGGLGDFTGVGPVWGVSADGDATRSIGWELAYNGARTPLENPLGMEGNPAAWRHGVSGMAKVFVPGMESLRPFAGVGIGAGYVNVNEAAEDVYRNDFQYEFPLAAGIDLESGDNWSAGVRATYRWLTGEEFAKTAAGADVEGGQLSASFAIGGRF